MASPNHVDPESVGRHRITVLTRPGCHLCDVARSVIEHIAAEFDVAWDERDITRSAADLQAYWDMIPVVLVDGTEHAFGRISADRLRDALRDGAEAPGRAGRVGASFMAAVRGRVRRAG